MGGDPIEGAVGHVRGVAPRRRGERDATSGRASAPSTSAGIIFPKPRRPHRDTIRGVPRRLPPTAFALCFAATLLTSPRLARAQSDEAGPTPRRRLANITLPVVPEAMRPAVTEARALVARSMNCWTSDGRTGTNRPSPECPSLYARLASGGDVTLHAIGTYLTSARNGHAFHTADELAGALEAHASLDVVPYVLAFVRTPLMFDDLDWGKDRSIYRYLRVLAAVTGNDLRPIPPWQYEAEETDGGLTAPQLMSLAVDAYRLWATWLRAHRGASIESVRAEGLTLARSRLDARDVALRVSAILRLGDTRAAPGDREAARLSLQRLLAARVVSNAGRRYLRAWAERQHLTLSPPTP